MKNWFVEYVDAPQDKKKIDIVFYSDELRNKEESDPMMSFVKWVQDMCKGEVNEWANTKPSEEFTRVEGEYTMLAIISTGIKNLFRGQPFVHVLAVYQLPATETQDATAGTGTV